MPIDRKLYREATLSDLDPLALAKAWEIFTGKYRDRIPEQTIQAWDTERKGSKVHAAVDTLGYLLALQVTAANEQDRAQVADLAQGVQAATGSNIKLAYVDQGYTGAVPAEAARRW